MSFDYTTYLYSASMSDQEIIDAITSGPEPPYPWDPIWLCFDEKLLPFDYVGTPDLPIELAWHLIFSRRPIAPSVLIRARRALFTKRYQEDVARSMPKDVVARVRALIENDETECMVCLENPPLIMATTKCGHIICGDCFELFLLMDEPSRCPMCRQAMLGDSFILLDVFTKVHGKDVQAGNGEAEEGPEKCLLD